MEDLRKSSKRVWNNKPQEITQAKKKVTLEELYQWLQDAILGLEDQLNDVRDQIEDLAELVEDSDRDTTEPLDYIN